MRDPIVVVAVKHVSSAVLVLQEHHRKRQVLKCSSSEYEVQPQELCPKSPLELAAEPEFMTGLLQARSNSLSGIKVQVHVSGQCSKYSAFSLKWEFSRIRNSVFRESAINYQSSIKTGTMGLSCWSGHIPGMRFD